MPVPRLRFSPSLRIALTTLALLLASCGGGGDGGGPSEVLQSEAALQALDPGNWEIGPVIGGRNYSRSMPAHPSASEDGSAWVIEMPQPDVEAGSVHYVTMPSGSLLDKTLVRMRFRVEAGEGVKIEPRTRPGAPAILTLYFQRQGDDWSARGAYEAFRWYATFASHRPIQVGEYTVEARFDQNWTAVLGSSREKNLAAFEDALAGAARIGFVLGGGDGYGHGVYATGPARLVVTAFEVE